jgi:hypothetical protein
VVVIGVIGADVSEAIVVPTPTLGAMDPPTGGIPVATIAKWGSRLHAKRNIDTLHNGKVAWEAEGGKWNDLTRRCDPAY